MGDEGTGSEANARGPGAAGDFRLRQVQPSSFGVVRRSVAGWLSAVLGVGSTTDGTKWEVVKTDPDGRSHTVFRHADRYAAIFEMSRLRTEDRRSER